MKIHVKESQNLVIPKEGTPQSAGYDVVAIEDPKIVGKEHIVNVPVGFPSKDIESFSNGWESIDYIEYRTGLFIAPQSDSYGHNYHTLILPRSSVRKYNLTLANSIALIDNDYRGELILCFKYVWQPEDFKVVLNSSIGSDMSIVGNINVNKIYKKGDRIGQVVSEVTNTIDWVVVADLSTTIRGSGGFGSTTDRKVEAPTEAHTLIDKWKSAGAESPTPPKYETIVKEREKLIS